MKRVLYLLVVLTFVMVGCRENLKELNKPTKPLAIAADKDTIYLDQTEYNSDGLTLSWTAGTNQGTGHRINYKLEVIKAGESYDNAIVVFENMTAVYQLVWKVDDINSLVVTDLQLPIDQPAALSARITASGEGFETQQAECTFVIIPYKPMTHTLYIIGNATPGGWTLADATPLEMREIGYFKTTLKLNKGFFKFITTQTGMLPGYMPGATDEDIALRENASQQDKMWQITEPHLYEVTVNLITMKLNLKQVSAVRPEYEDLYLIGKETDWLFWRMQVDPIDPFLFRIGHYWTIGEDFKFGTANGSWENNYKAASENAPLTEEGMSFIKGFDPDPKWYMTADQINKMYKICVDIHTSEERMMMRPFTPYTEMYLVGDATPGGWSLDDATPMVQVDDSIFTWTGKLTAGALKFSCDKQSDFMGAWFMAYNDGAEPTGDIEPMLFIDKTADSFTRYQYAKSEGVVVDDIDQKWTISKAGTYTITLDQLHETISIVAQ